MLGEGLVSAFQGPVCRPGPDIGYPGFLEVIIGRVCLTGYSPSVRHGYFLELSMDTGSKFVAKVTMFWSLILV